MKSGLVWILVPSLVVNGVLLGARWRSSVSSESAMRASRDSAVARAAADEAPPPAGAVAIPVAAGATTTPARPAPQGSLWSRLDLGDLESVVATLRAAGTPESELRTIVEALVREQFKARIEAVQRGGTDQPFWRTRSTNATAATQFSESYAIWREIEAATVKLLGPEPLDPVNAYGLRQRFGDLPDEKLRALVNLDRDYGDLSSQARSSLPGPTMPWEREQLAFVEAEKRRDIEALLSPDELERYDLYTSRTAMALHRQLAGFAPTEAEFRAIYAMQYEFDRTHRVNQSGTTAADWSAAQKARPALLEQIKAHLGEARYADYVRSTDTGYQAALAVTRRLSLPADRAAAAYDLTRDIQARAQELRTSTGVGAAERSAAMGALLDEANSRLAGLLTTEGAEVFKARSGGVFRSLESAARRQP